MPRLFDHVDLRVPDLGAVAPFYRILLPALGFTREVCIEGWLQFEADGDGETATEFFGLTEDRAHRLNATRIAFHAVSRARVDELAALLPGIGARHIEGPDFETEDLDTYYAVFFEDPAGNRLEIVHRTRKFTSAVAPERDPASLPPR